MCEFIRLFCVSYISHGTVISLVLTFPGLLCCGVFTICIEFGGWGMGKAGTEKKSKILPKEEGGLGKCLPVKVYRF